MSAVNAERGTLALKTRDLEPILAVTRRLAAAFDVREMLVEVVHAAQRVLHAERCSVWLFDAASNELVLQVSSDLTAVRIPAGAGIVGSCASTRLLINVPDCYADARFNPALDRQTNFRTRCMLSIPLIGHRDDLVGVVQVLNKADGVFDADDEALATALAAQCAVALQRAQMTSALIDGERMRQQLELARSVQMSTLPQTTPEVEGYDAAAVFQPAELTGGDTFDLAKLEQGLLIVLGDATGHGLAPALHVTQMHAMLRMALRMGADLETAFIEVNNQLEGFLPDDRFITAFLGILDTDAHELRFHSGGQAPILVFEAARGACAHYQPTSFPLGAMPLTRIRPATTVPVAPGDILVLLSDGVYEYQNLAGEQFGEARVREIVATHRDEPAEAIAAHLLAAVGAFAPGAAQDDDISMVIVKRRATDSGAVSLSARALARDFARRIDEVASLVEFTAQGFAALRIDPALLHTVDFVIEELFTNMVKYSRVGAVGVNRPIELTLEVVAGGVEVSLTEHDVDAFDITQVAAVDVGLPIEKREPGGLGLHLVRTMVDSLTHHYNEQSRESRVVFRATASPTSGPETSREVQDTVLTIESGPAGVVTITGRLDAAESPKAQAFLDQVQGQVSLDCSRLDYISSAGLGVLLKTQKRLLASAGRLRLTGLGPHLLDIFRYSGFDQIFEIEPAA
jgi:phosphoserine phosphatase